MTSTTLRELAIEYAWRAHPAREQPRRALGGAACIVAFAALVGIASSSALVGLVSAAVLVLTLNRFYLPTRYEIDAEGMTARYPLRTQRMSWTLVRRFLHDEYGGYLSTRATRSRLDAFSGMHLKFGSSPDQVILEISQRLQSRGCS